VDQAPRTLLRRQLDRLDKQGLSAYAASELEFYLFREGYRAASERGHRDLTPSSSYLIDYHLAQPARDEDVLARLRNELTESGIVVEGTKGEWGRGQHEINLLYGRALEAADGHVICKHAAKEIAAQQDRSITFMAKPSTQDAGSSCHIHFSLWNESGDQSLFSDDTGVTPLFRQFLAGLCKYTRELSYFFAPTVNSYKRYQPESWAPTALVWAHDNRTTGFRVVGQGSSLRIENRMPGADANPYLAYAATIAAGLAGIAESLPCPAPYTGNAYADASLAQLPSSLAQAADLLDASALARSAFGDPVVDYYVHAARLEAAAYGREVSDWERARYFERI
jgi:glutamine synthetase